MILRYILVLDFEATCSPTLARSDMEIIEFPIVVVDMETRTVVAEFHSYVRATLHDGLLDPFCTELTGIDQETVNGAPDFRTVFADACAFCTSYLARGIFVTCGDWDLKSMLPTQCARSGLAIPDDFTCWINIKQAFHAWNGQRPRGMVDMLSVLGMPLVGRHHSGIDDSRNIAAVAMRMLEGGHVFEPTPFKRSGRHPRYK
ncbi:hypothetical protein ACHHYP_20614 [Achlya hypogyna]|uniref:Exonuclease domain-containing protein n=1 Tax=Achlya hypogyna TaxID=1202772 RepID=A0A1V9YH59_ACHHY|nr:hypothetical protein ACHHYP_20614 [Achlya hypogyna]